VTWLWPARLSILPRMKGPVLVIGATGQQGGAVARALLERGWSVHALVRDPARPAAQSLAAAGAVLVVGDLDDQASLLAAMRQVAAAFLVLTMMTGPRVTLQGVAAEERRGKAVADVAAEAGIEHLVYSSIEAADLHTGIPHIESKGHIEEHITSLSLPATFLRPAFFMDNLSTFTRPSVVGGEVVVRLGLGPETRLRMIATRDIGVFAAVAFDQRERFLGRRLEIAGDELTGPRMAERLAAACGLPARFQEVPIDQLRAFDPEVARMFEWFNTRSAEGVPRDLNFAELREYHPGLMTLADWLRATGWKPAPASSTEEGP
jgi:uncharacterized protein YbjT (DUF2867 family)